MKLARFNEDASQQDLLSMDATETEVLAAIDQLDAKRVVILWANEVSYVQAVQREESGEKCQLNYANDLDDCYDILPSPRIDDVKRAFIYFLNGDVRLFEEFHWVMLNNHYEDGNLSIAAEVVSLLAEQEGAPNSKQLRAMPPSWVETLKAIIQLIITHKETLIRKRSQLCYKNDYGGIERDRWAKEVDVFRANVVTSAVRGLPELPPASADFLSIVDAVLDLGANEAPSVPDAAGLDPFEYERFCAQQLEEAGWSTRMTAATGDQGTDIVANKNGISVAIQCKKYSSPVGNAAVQEIIAGKAFENTRFAVVVTNSTYTPHAIQLAQRASVVLLHHSELKGLFDRLTE